MNRKNIFLSVLSIFILAACNDSKGGGDNTPAPVIERIETVYEDNTAVAGKPVTLIGSNFSPVAEENTVLYGIGVDAVSISVIESSNDYVIFSAPDVLSTKIKIRVKTKGKESNVVDLYYYVESPESGPHITGVATEYENGVAVPGGKVTLTGTGFSAVRSQNKVVYGSGADQVKLSVSEASETQLVFTAPEMDVKSLDIKVAVSGTESNGVTLTYPGEWSGENTLNLPGAVTVTVAPGVEWTTFHGTWEGSTRNINIVKTNLEMSNTLGVFFDYRSGDNTLEGYPEVKPDEDYRDLDYKCIYMGAVAGTNGSMACCQFVRVDGVEKNPPKDDDYFAVNAVLKIDNGVVDIISTESNYTARKLTNDPEGRLDAPYNTLSVACAGPLLVNYGTIRKYPEEFSADFLKTTHPRTAFGISKDGKTVYQVAVDGRFSGTPEKTAVGMSTPVLSKFMKGLGCYKAMNFDGGGGTAMWVKGYGNSRNIVNHVCESGKWTSTVLRPTGTAVYIKHVE